MGSGNLREVTAPALSSSLQRRTHELRDGWRGVGERVWQQSRWLSMFQWVWSDSSVSYTLVCVFACARVTIRGKMAVGVRENGAKMHTNSYRLMYWAVMSPWFDVASGLNFHPLAFMSVIAASCICDDAIVCCGSGGGVVRCVCSSCGSVCDSQGGMRAVRKRGWGADSSLTETKHIWRWEMT